MVVGRKASRRLYKLVCFLWKSRPLVNENRGFFWKKKFTWTGEFVLHFFSSVIRCFLVVHLTVETVRFSWLCQNKAFVVRCIYKVMSPRLGLCKLLPIALRHACVCVLGLVKSKPIFSFKHSDPHHRDKRWWCWNTLLVGRATNWPVQLKQIAHAHFLCCFLFNYLNGIKMDMFYIFSIHLSLRSKWFQQLNDIWYVAPSHYDIKLIFLDGDEMHWARLALVTGRPSIAVLMGMAIN